MAIIITLQGTSTLDESAGLQGLLTTDADNDVAVGTLPAAFSTRLFTGLGLSNAFPTAVGVAASPAELIDINSTGGALSSLGFTDSAGAALNGDASGITTADDQPVFLWTDPTNPKILLGTTSSTIAPGQPGAGDVVFAVFMQDTIDTDGTTDVKLWHVTFEALEHPNPAATDEAVDLLQNAFVTATGPLSFSFDELPSGANLFGVVGQSATDPAIIVIGRTPVFDPGNGKYTNASDVIHTSQGGQGATIGVNNQMFDPGEGAYFTYVNDPVATFLSGVPGGLSATEADDADNIQYTGGLLNAEGGSFTISQDQGNGTFATTITAFELNDDRQGRDFANNLGAAGGSQVTIDTVRVLASDGVTVLEEATLLGGTTINDPTIEIAFANGSAMLTGLDAGQTVAWETDGDHNQVLVEGAGGKFDIGAFSVTEGDIATAPLVNHVFVEDDASTLGPIADSTVDFVAGATGPVTLNGDSNIDAAGTYAITDFTASLVVGGVTLIGENSGTDVKYFQDNDSSGTFSAGDLLYYTLALSSTTDPGAYTFTVNNAPDAPPLVFNFDEMPSGSSLFGMVGSETDALAFFGKTPVLKANGQGTNTSDVIHTSQGGTGATIGVNNQMFDPGDGAYFTYVHDPDTSILAGFEPGGLNATEGDDADNLLYNGGLLDTDTASFLISQDQGNGSATAKITAFDLEDDFQARDMIDNRGLDGGDQIAIDAIKVFSANGTLLEDTAAALDDPNIGVVFAGGTATVSGLDAGYTVEWHTTADHNQVLVEGVEGKFDIGRFEINEPQPTNDHQLDFEVTLTDTDLDPVVSTFSIFVDGNHDGLFT